MRILLANTGHPSTIKGGAEAAALDLAHALVERGHEVSLVVHHGGRDLERSTDRGVAVYALPNRNLYFAFDGAKRPAPLRLAWHALDGTNPFMARAFGRILDEVRPDIVNTHVVVGLSQLVWREAARRGIPVVHYLHEYGTMCPRGSAFREGELCRTPCGPCRVLTMPRRRLSQLVDTVVGVSRFTLQRHLDWGFFPGARTAVLPNIFKDVAVREHRRGGSDDPVRFGYFGRLIPDKGAHLLIEALSRFADGWTLDVAGTGEPDYVASLKAAAPPNVRFLGWTRADDFYPAIDVAVAPSSGRTRSRASCSNRSCTACPSSARMQAAFPSRSTRAGPAGCFAPARPTISPGSCKPVWRIAPVFASRPRPSASASRSSNRSS
jgi:glycosyltransferase involved in cell wall biosynthesis